MVTTSALPAPRPESNDDTNRRLDTNPWHTVLYARFCRQPLPLVVFEKGAIPAAALWTGARLWCSAFRQAGLEAGDRVVLALPPSPAFLQVLLAALWEGLTVALVHPESALEKAREQIDARASIGVAPDAYHWQPDGPSGPLETCPAAGLRSTRGPRTPDARLLLRTSGTTAVPRWIALSDTNIFSVLDSHLPELNLSQARVLSVLPWHHAFGLIIDLLPALLSGAEIVRDPAGGRDSENIARLLREWQTTHMSAVPLLLQRLAEREAGLQLLTSLQGGVVGGAPVSAKLAETLALTRLRAGYGQTEASPGIALGKPGVWAVRYLGRPLGCTTRISPEGTLEFSGDNACLGLWDENGLHRLAPSRWVGTGDLVHRQEEDLYFAGRADDGFKLSNGRFVQAGRYETLLKARFALLEEALLFTRDGESLELCVWQPEGAKLPDAPALDSCLAGLAQRLRGIHPMLGTALVRTPKGSMDRTATLTCATQALADMQMRSPALS